MSRLGVSAEGATEREFINRVLRPHLALFNVSVTAIDMRGNISLDKIRGVLPALFGSFDLVSTFYDFYGFKGRQQRTIDELEVAIHEQAAPPDRPRFLPYLQQYEFEALLFAAPVQTVDWLGGTAANLAAMQDAIRRCGSAEQVNDSLVSSPSHRIRALFPRYDKKLHGPDIVELAGLAVVRAQCPRFDAWIHRLEQLGKGPLTAWPA